jgi:RNA polymerase sigma-70 factor (ECF subfamily)
LVRGLRANDQQAAAEVFARFSTRLIALARKRLGGTLRRKVDAEDVLQSAYGSFFARAAGGQFDLADWGGLWALLVRITLRKCGHRLEEFRSARRDLRREVPMGATGDDSVAAWEPLARTPSPAEAAILAETVEGLLRALDDERHRQVVVLSLQGHELAEIAREVGLSERTVYRVLEKIKEVLLRRIARGDGA